MWRLVLLGLLIVPKTEAATVCIEQLTGKVLESSAHTQPGICQRNYVADNPQYGYQATDITERTVTELERRELVKAWDSNPLNPDMPKRATQRASQEAREARLKLKLGLTNAEFDDLKAVAR